MQQTKPGAPKALVYKPYLQGRALSALSIRRGLRILLYQVIFIFVYLFLGQVLLFDITWLRILINLAFILGFAALLFNDGAKAGVDDVAFAEIALQRKEKGQAITNAELDRCYHPLKGFVTVIAGVLPFFLLALLFSFLATLQVYHLGTLPSWVAGFERRADVGLALQYYHETRALGLEDILRIIMRLLLFPFVNLVGTHSAPNLLLLERLSPLLVFVIPMGYAVGYLQGPRMRAAMHGAISTNKLRQTARERKERRRRQHQGKTLV